MASAYLARPVIWLCLVRAVRRSQLSAPAPLSLSFPCVTAVLVRGQEGWDGAGSSFCRPLGDSVSPCVK